MAQNNTYNSPHINHQSPIINLNSLIDTHCHIEMPVYDSDRKEVLKRAKDIGIEAIIAIGSDLESSEGSVNASNKYEFVYAAVGIHPHDAKDYSPEVEKRILEIARAKRVVAIGEIGLDYHYDNSPREVQKRVFKRQLYLAHKLNMPVVIHSRDAKEDTLRIISESMASRGVMHCFSGDIDMAERAMAMGFYISIAGPVTFKNARKLQEIIEKIPDEYLIIETDAPYLTPVPYRGRRNEPSYLIHTANKMAELRGVTVEDIARITTLNAKRLFGIGEIPDRGTIVYKIRESIYLNITNRCTNACSFCVRFHTDYVKGYKLKLDHEPDIDELKAAIGSHKDYKEVVFCGYGEPLIRLDLVKTLSKWLKKGGGRVRINTNGHGNIIHKRNILPELKGIVDSISISLDAQDEKTYKSICRPFFKNAFKEVISFIKESQKYIPEVTITVVDAPGVNISRCKEIAEELRAKFRVRKYNVVG